MITIVLEGKKISCEKDFHHEMAILFEFPDYYGNNLDALVDCLREWTSSVQNEKIKIIWQDHLHSKTCLGEELFNTIREILEEVGPYMKEDIVVEYK